MYLLPVAFILRTLIQSVLSHRSCVSVTYIENLFEVIDCSFLILPAKAFHFYTQSTLFPSSPPTHFTDSY